MHRPVFVDDSGRRRRAAGIVGTTSGVLALAYVIFVGLTFAGVPGVGELDAGGLGSLTNPAGEQADVGSHPVEQAVPAPVADAAGPTDVPATTADGRGPDEAPVGPVTAAAPVPPPVTTTTTLPVTTTTRHGQGPTTSVPGPNSTVPDKGGPPTSRPGGQ